MKGQCYQNLPYPTKALKSKAEPLFKNDGSHFTNSHRTFFDFTCKSNRNLVSSINTIPSWISLTYPPLIRKKNPEILSLRSNPANCSSTALAPIWPNRNWNSWSGLGHHQKNFHKFPCHSIHPISFSLSGDLTPAPLKSSTFHRRGQNDDLLQTTKFVFKFSCCSEGKRRRKLQVHKFISLDGRIIMNVWFARLYIEFFTFSSLLLLAFFALSFRGKSSLRWTVQSCRRKEGVLRNWLENMSFGDWGQQSRLERLQLMWWHRRCRNNGVV